METPSTKVALGAVAGAVVTVIIWIVEATTSLNVEPAIAAALVVVVTFVLSYFVRETNPPNSATT